MNHLHPVAAAVILGRNCLLNNKLNHHVLPALEQALHNLDLVTRCAEIRCFSFNSSRKVMQIVGDISRFGIKFDLNDVPGGAWMYGRLCFYCGGQQVGDFEQGTSLRDVLFQLEEILKDKGRRNNPRFQTMPAGEMLHLVMENLYGDKAHPYEDAAQDEQWARHIVSPSVDIFDGWKAMLVEDSQAARLMFSGHPYSTAREVALQCGEVDAVLEAACHALVAIYEKLLHTPENDVGLARGSTW